MLHWQSLVVRVKQMFSVFLYELLFTDSLVKGCVFKCDSGQTAYLQNMYTLQVFCFLKYITYTEHELVC
jgi:hypothetical protein